MAVSLSRSVRLGWLAALGMQWVAGFALSAELPAPSPNDARIRVVPYRSHDVTVVRVQRGTVTRIVLESDERIEVPVVGLSSDCKAEADEWCISAIVGSNQIFVRPRDGATRNNMELHTSKRDYSFSFEVVAEEEGVSHGKRAHLEVPFYRVVFDYPKPTKPAEHLTAGSRAAAVETLLRRVDVSAARPVPAQVDPDYGMTAVQRLRSEGIRVRNTQYSKQVLERGEDAEPVTVFDDGRFTYFEFPGAREIPAVFAHGSDGEATRVNWHMSGDFLVVQRTARKFTLRLGQAVVGIFNEAFDTTGIETPTSTVSSTVVRVVKEGNQ